MSAMMMPEDVDAMAMEQALAGGAPVDPMMGDMGEMVSVQVPSWAVPAVEELVSILEAEVASGNVTPDMLMDVGSADMGGDMAMPMEPGMGADMGAQPF